MIADGGYRGTPPTARRPRRACLRPHETLEDPPRLPPDRRRRSQRHARHRPPGQRHVLGGIPAVCDGPAPCGLGQPASRNRTRDGAVGCRRRRPAVQQRVVSLRASALVAVVGSDCGFAAQVDADRAYSKKYQTGRGICGVASWHAPFVDRWILRSAVDDEDGQWRDRRRTVRAQPAAAGAPHGALASVGDRGRSGRCGSSAVSRVALVPHLVCSEQRGG